MKWSQVNIDIVSFFPGGAVASPNDATTSLPATFTTTANDVVETAVDVTRVTIGM